MLAATGKRGLELREKKAGKSKKVHKHVEGARARPAGTSVYMYCIIPAIHNINSGDTLNRANTEENQISLKRGGVG